MTHKSTPFIGSGLSELRNVLSSPGDQLYQHLTDLILALDEANGVNSLSNAGNFGKNCLARSDRTNGTVVEGAQNYGGRSTMMDTSTGPSCRKVRRKRRRKRCATLPASGMGVSVSDKNGGGSKSRHQPSAPECVSQSPINFTSDSSLDESTQLSAPAKNVLTGVSDSEMERLLPQAIVPTSKAIFRNVNVADLCQLRSSCNKRFPVCSDASSALSPFWTQAPIESDSFTETVTPARHGYQRRKRLTKRMTVDHHSGDMEIFDDFQRQQNNPMDVDVSPHCTRSGQRLPVTFLANSFEECYAHTCPSTSDTDDGHNSSDAGRQGDDELSDWYPDRSDTCTLDGGDECMGVPELKETVRLSSATTLNVESSDTDMSQSSSSKPSRRFLSRSGAAVCGAMNRRILEFLHDQTETELSLGELRKRERKEALRLAMFYHLDVRREGAFGYRYYVLCKTKYS